MSKIKDITKRCNQALKPLKESGIYKKVLAYDLEDCEILYCITNDNKLHLSGSSEYGIPPLPVMLDAFKQLTNKDISNFKLMQTEEVLYFIEKDA